MELILVRHGETIWNRERRTQGFTDIELTETGLMQAELLAGALESRKLGSIYSSPLKRAFETACIIAKPHGLPVQPVAALMELNQGDLEGMTFRELRATYRELLDSWLLNPALLKMPNGESLKELQDRAWPAVEQIFETHDEGVVAVVSHNLCIITILCKVLQVNLNSFRRIRQNNAAINIIEKTTERGIVLTLMNDICHLNGLNTI